jgi:hypothetical protein
MQNAHAGLRFVTAFSWSPYDADVEATLPPAPVLCMLVNLRAQAYIS